MHHASLGEPGIGPEISPSPVRAEEARVWQQFAVVGLGGAIGAIARYGVSLACLRMLPSFPLGTLVVNVLGCFALGLLMAIVDVRSEFPPTARLFLGVGLLGAFTTFSTFGVETIDLLREKENTLAMLSVTGNLVLGLAAVLLGRGVAKWVG